MARAEGCFHVACISFCCDKTRPGAPVHSNRMGSGAEAHWRRPRDRSPSCQSPLGARVPGYAPVRPRAPASWPSKLVMSWGPPCPSTHQHFFRRTAPSPKQRSCAAEKMRHPSPASSSVSCRRHGPRRRLRVYATNGKRSCRSWPPGWPAPWPCRISSPCAGARLCRVRNGGPAGRPPHRRPT